MSARLTFTIEEDITFQEWWENSDECVDDVLDILVYLNETYFKDWLFENCPDYFSPAEIVASPTLPEIDLTDWLDEINAAYAEEKLFEWFSTTYPDYPEWLAAKKEEKENA